MYWKSHYHVKSHTLVKKLKYFYGIIENDSDDKVSLFEKSARIQLVSKNIQLGSARFQKSTSSAQLGKIQLGSAAQLANFQLGCITTNHHLKDFTLRLACLLLEQLTLQLYQKQCAVSLDWNHFKYKHHK